MVAEDAAAGLASPLTNQALRNQARDILQGAEYQAYMADKPKPGDDWLSKWLDQIGQWLHDLFRDHPPEVGDTGGKALEQFIHIGFFSVLVFVALVLLLALLWWGYTLVRAWLAARRRDNRLPVVTHADRQALQQSHCDAAAASLAAGDYRQAIHYLFLAATARLVDDAVFAVSDVMTGRELLAHCRLEATSPDLATALGQLHAIDEPRWFGRQEALQTDYAVAQSAYEVFDRQLQCLQPVRHGGDAKGAA